DGSRYCCESRTSPRSRASLPGPTAGPAIRAVVRTDSYSGFAPRAPREQGSALHRHPAGVVGPAQQHRRSTRAEVFVHRAAGAVPVPIVIDEENPALTKTQIEV